LTAEMALTFWRCPLVATIGVSPLAPQVRCKAASDRTPASSTLSGRQQRQVRRCICGKDPRQYGFDFGMWTRRIVADLVEEKFDHKLSVISGIGIWPMPVLRVRPVHSPKII
jgi:hypothetical protein